MLCEYGSSPGFFSLLSPSLASEELRRSLGHLWEACDFVLGALLGASKGQVAFWSDLARTAQNQLKTSSETSSNISEAHISWNCAWNARAHPSLVEIPDFQGLVREVLGGFEGSTEV